ncbi:MAG: hypothetical protein JWP79_316 [Polaromonas sp.]|jgi:hypothetical protein|nr:hypothetical protein [Polaromonas sp.]
MHHSPWMSVAFAESGRAPGSQELRLKGGARLPPYLSIQATARWWALRRLASFLAASVHR